MGILLAKSSLMPETAGLSGASVEETGMVSGVVVVEELGKGYIRRPYGEDALRRADVT